MTLESDALCVMTIKKDAKFGKELTNSKLT